MPLSSRNLTAGMRNNNPGNIKFIGQPGTHASANTDQGDPQAVFETPQAGMNAMFQLLRKKYARGLTTPLSIISGKGGWTPGNTIAAQNVAAYMGIKPDQDINLNDPKNAQRFMRALMRQEHGDASLAYGDDMLKKAVMSVAAPSTTTSVTSAAPTTPTPQNYMALAKSKLGMNERDQRAALKDFLVTGGQNLDPGTTAWCAAFVNASLEHSGLKGTGSMMARSFLNYGTAVDPKDIRVGDIAVYARGRAPEGHVGFVNAIDPKTGQVTLLGGNQGNAVSLQNYDINSALGFRRPDAAPADGTVTAGGAPPGDLNLGTELKGQDKDKSIGGLLGEMAQQSQPQQIQPMQFQPMGGGGGSQNGGLSDYVQQYLASRLIKPPGAPPGGGTGGQAIG